MIRKGKRTIVWRLAKIYLRLVSYLLAFVIVLQLAPIHRAVVMPFTSFVALAAKIVINLFGAGATVQDNCLTASGFSINIVDGCNGVYAIAILISGVLAYPVAWKHRLWGILLGTLAIFSLNLVRVISLFYVGQHYPGFFEGVHVYVWQPIIIVWAIIVWDFWSRQTGKKEALS
jgi:exosortase H (IPTLxxWG-CTERM-specific)